MIDNNIIKSLGAGSGVDSNNIVKQLTEIERSGPQTRIDTKRELAETRISDLGKLNSALSTLRGAADAMLKPEGLFSKSASFTESSALAPSKLSTDVQPGIYNFQVQNVAQAQAIAFDEYASDKALVGEGTLTFNFGQWSRDGGGLGEFAPQAGRESVTIKIDESNNTLRGLRDAINKADMGVTASIVQTGTGYRLSLLAASGAHNELQVVASESGDAGLANFAFDDTTAARETQTGRDAELRINGLTVFRPSNTIDDVVEGLTLDLYKAAPGETVTVTVEEDKAFAEQNIRDFIAGYNAFLEEVKPLLGTYEQENEDGSTEVVVGSLAKDALAKSVLSRIRATIANAIPGLTNSNLTSLTNIGIRTELDGSLTIEEEEFAEAMTDRFTDVQKLLAPQTYTDNDDIVVNSYGKNTRAGIYDVQITTQPSRGYLQGAAIDNTPGSVEFPNFDTTGKDYSFKIRLNGTESGTIAIPEAGYADEHELAAAIQLAVNSDALLQEVNGTVTVSYDTDNNSFVFTSAQYGVNSKVSIIEASDDVAADLGLGVAGGVAGVNVAGTINGVQGFGSANVLLPALGERAEGLAMIVGEGASGATVNFSRGFAGELDDLINQFLEKNGVISLRQQSLQSDLKTLEDDQSALERKMTAFEERLINQFIAMEKIINGLNSSGSFLENLIDTLPFTAKSK